MYLSAIAHYKNKYPKGSVKADDHSVDVYGEDGSHKVALRKDGNGQWVDRSEQLGCDDRHDLSPIPKEARLYKVYKDGKIAKAEEYKSRKKGSDELTALPVGGPGKVPSIQELHVACNPDADPTSGFTHDASWEKMKPAYEKQFGAKPSSEEKPSKKDKK